MRAAAVPQSSLSAGVAWRPGVWLVSPNFSQQWPCRSSDMFEMLQRPSTPTVPGILHFALAMPPLSSRRMLSWLAASDAPVLMPGLRLSCHSAFAADSPMDPL